MTALLNQERIRFHQNLLRSILTIDATGIPSNADRGNSTSIAIAKQIYDYLVQEVQSCQTIKEPDKQYLSSRNKTKGQTSGKLFEK